MGHHRHAAPALISISFMALLLLSVIPLTVMADGPSSRLAPTVTIENPDPSYHALGATIRIQGQIGDDGEIRLVEILTMIGGSWENITSSFDPWTSRYAWDWYTTGEAAGEHRVSVRVTDDESRTAMTGVRIYLDGDDPDVKIEEPAGTLVTKGLGTTITISGEADDDTTHVAYLNISFDGGDNWLDITEELDRKSWSYDWETKPTDEPGTYEIIIRAEDAVGNEDEDTVDILLSDIEAPSVFIEFPEEGKEMEPGESISVKGSATDNIGVTKLELVVPGKKDPVDVTSRLYSGSFRWTWETDDMGLGIFELKAAATDAKGNVGEGYVNVTFVDEEDPTLDLRAPLDKAQITKGKPIPITGTAKDNLKVASLEVIVDTEEPINITEELDKKGSFSYSLTNVKKGKHTVTVRVTDMAGQWDEDTRTIIIKEKSTSPAVSSSAAGGAAGAVVLVILLLLIFMYVKRMGPFKRKAPPPAHDAGAVAPLPPPPGATPGPAPPSQDLYGQTPGYAPPGPPTRTRRPLPPPPTVGTVKPPSDLYYAGYEETYSEEAYPGVTEEAGYMDTGAAYDEGTDAGLEPPPKRFGPPALAKTPEQAPAHCPVCGLDIDYENLMCPDCGAKLY
jgi:hypothetical protein